MLMPRTEHTADRPTWDCRVCGRPWPCAVAKVELSEHFASMGLGLFMASCWYEAIESFRWGDAQVPADLYDRFLGWVANANGPGPPPRYGAPVEPASPDET